MKLDRHSAKNHGFNKCTPPKQKISLVCLFVCLMKGVLPANEEKVTKILKHRLNRIFCLVSEEFLLNGLCYG